MTYIGELGVRLPWPPPRLPLLLPALYRQGRGSRSRLPPHPTVGVRQSGENLAIELSEAQSDPDDKVSTIGHVALDDPDSEFISHVATLRGPTDRNIAVVTSDNGMKFPSASLASRSCGWSGPMRRRRSRLYIMIEANVTGSHRLNPRCHSEAASTQLPRCRCWDCRTRYKARR